MVANGVITEKCSMGVRYKLGGIQRTKKKNVGYKPNLWVHLASKLEGIHCVFIGHHALSHYTILTFDYVEWEEI